MISYINAGLISQMYDCLQSHEILYIFFSFELKACESVLQFSLVIVLSIKVSEVVYLPVAFVLHGFSPSGKVALPTSLLDYIFFATYFGYLFLHDFRHFVYSSTSSSWLVLL